jgi:hypothetical protein
MNFEVEVRALLYLRYKTSSMLSQSLDMHKKRRQNFPGCEERRGARQTVKWKTINIFMSFRRAEKESCAHALKRERKKI